MCKPARQLMESGRAGKRQKRMEGMKLTPVQIGGEIMGGRSSARGRRREMVMTETAMTDLLEKAKVVEKSL